jgi:hypothetical protein
MGACGSKYAVVEVPGTDTAPNQVVAKETKPEKAPAAAVVEEEAEYGDAEALAVSLRCRWSVSLFFRLYVVPSGHLGVILPISASTGGSLLKFWKIPSVGHRSTAVCINSERVEQP